MQSDIIVVKSNGEGVEKAVKQAELVAAYKSFDEKDAIHLRLLTEELMGMVQGISNDVDLAFWIEDEDGVFKLHLIADTQMTNEMRKKFMSASTSGKNASAKGFMGKIRDLFERAFEPIDENTPGTYSTGWMFSDLDPVGATYTNVWSFNRYKESIDKDSSRENWEELERSIVANIADEVEVGIKGGRVEMIIYKKF